MDEKKISVIFGKRGSGKSYLANKLLESERRLVVFDVMGEYANGVVFNAEQYEQFTEFWRRVYRGNFRLIYRPLRPDVEIERIAELVYACGNITFLVEEIDCYCSAYSISDNFAAIIQRGRHRNIQLIGVTQRPFGIHRLVTSQAKEIYVFNTNEPRDRDYLKNLLGVGVEAKLDELKQYDYLRWSDDGTDELRIERA